jgi:hypothetical protein
MTDAPHTEPEQEIACLRARVELLETTESAQLADRTERANIAINHQMEIIRSLQAENARLEAEVTNLRLQIERMTASEVAP